MPEMSGLTLITEAKAIQPLLSVLVLSAYDNFEYVRTALRNGAENYLLKPLNPEELLESIQSVAKHLKERNTLSNTYGSSMLTFRSLFTENWVKGTLDSADFLTRAELLGINLSLNNYTVCIFLLQTPTHRKCLLCLTGFWPPVSESSRVISILRRRPVLCVF